MVFYILFFNPIFSDFQLLIKFSVISIWKSCWLKAKSTWSDAIVGWKIIALIYASFLWYIWESSVVYFFDIILIWNDFHAFSVVLEIWVSVKLLLGFHLLHAEVIVVQNPVLLIQLLFGAHLLNIIGACQIGLVIERLLVSRRQAELAPVRHIYLLTHWLSLIGNKRIWITIIVPSVFDWWSRFIALWSWVLWIW